MKVAYTPIVALMICSCSFGTVLSEQAVDYNETVSVAADALLVRNILRAKDNAPVHFTAVPQLRRGVSGGISSSLEAPFGRYLGKAAGVNMISLNANASVSPTIDIATLDTQEFTKGLLNPVEPELFKYFWDRGISRQLLMFLFFATIENLMRMERRCGELQTVFLARASKMNAKSLPILKSLLLGLTNAPSRNLSTTGHGEVNLLIFATSYGLLRR